MNIDYMDVLDDIIREEIEKKRRIAFYPYGKYGKIGEQIAIVKYGKYNNICIDNLSEDNRVLRMEDFLSENFDDVTMIITTIQHDLNYKLQHEVKRYNIESRNVLEPVFKLGESLYDKEKKRHHEENTIVVLGDSHVNFFSGNETMEFKYLKNDMRLSPTINGLPFTVIHMGGSLAYNCNRYGTSTRFKEKLEYLEKDFLKKDAKIMISLGEIDIRKHIFRQSEMRGESPEKIAESVVNEYMTLLRELKDKGYNPIALGPVAASTVRNVDLQTSKSIQLVNQVTEFYTKRLLEECQKEKISCLSVFDKMINEDYTTKKEFQIDGCHLKQKAMQLYCEKLFRML